MKLFFEELIGIGKFHDKYKLLNREYLLGGERKILESWATGFVDRDNKVLNEFQTTFHSTFWEFYIYQLLKNMNEKIDFTKNRPDFIVKNNDDSDKYYIEAVVSEIKKDGRPEADRTYEDLDITATPVWKLPDFEDILNEGIIRCSNAFDNKLKKYTEYKKDSWFKTNVPYIVGMSSFSQINYGLECHYSILALLYGLYLNNDGLSFEKRYSVVKQNTGASLPLNIFDSERNSDVSAVLFSSKVTLGKLTALSISQGDHSHSLVVSVYLDSEPPFFKIKPVSEDNPEYFEDGLFLMHNHKAKNPLDPNVFKGQGIIQVIKENDRLVFDGEQLPLICRVNRCMEKSLESIYVNRLFYDFNYPIPT